MEIYVDFYFIESFYDHFSQFKTKRYYGYQPIIIPDQAKRYLQAYASVIRPLVLEHLDKPVQQSDPLFIQYNGNPQSISHRLSEFTSLYCGVKMASRLLRSLLETSMNQLYTKGLVTSAELAASNLINGHNSVR
jgi:hypothetical protein